jgi:hypothetical protein
LTGYYFIDMNADKMAHRKRLSAGGPMSAFTPATRTRTSRRCCRRSRIAARAKTGDGAAADSAQASPLLGITTLAAIVLYLTAALYTFSAPLGERAASTRARSAMR